MCVSLMDASEAVGLDPTEIAVAAPAASSRPATISATSSPPPASLISAVSVPHRPLDPPLCTPVLDAPAAAALPLIPVLCSAVSPSQTSSLLRLLNSQLPLPSLTHLKRVFSSKASPSPLILLCLPPLASVLTSSTFAPFSLSPELRLVPSRAPVTRAEAEELRGYWPLSAVLKEEPPVVFSAEERYRMTKRMRLLMQLADDGAARGQRWRAAAIVDPRTGCVVVADHDWSLPPSPSSPPSSADPASSSSHHLLHHPAIVVISALAAIHLALPSTPSAPATPPSTGSVPSPPSPSVQRSVLVHGSGRIPDARAVRDVRDGHSAQPLPARVLRTGCGSRGRAGSGGRLEAAPPARAQSPLRRVGGTVQGRAAAEAERD